MKEWSNEKWARRLSNTHWVKGFGFLMVLALAGANDSSSRPGLTEQAFQWRQARVDFDAKPYDPHGAPTAVTPELFPAAVTSLGGTQRVALDAEVENATDRELDVAVAFEILRDDGKALGGRRVSVLRKLLPRHRGISLAPEISSALGDGYYCVRLTTAWMGGDEEGTTAAYLYVQITEGRVDILPESEWIEVSAHNVAVAG